MDKKLFGTRINKARKDRGLTAEKLAEACNINSTYLRQIEGGKKLPSLPVFATLCRELRVSPNYKTGSDAINRRIDAILLELLELKKYIVTAEA